VPNVPSKGLPPRTYLPIVAVIAIVFLSIMAVLLRAGFGTVGSAFGPGTQPSAPGAQPQNVSVGGGPPPAVAAQLGELRGRIATHPNDDVALAQLGDMYLTVGEYDKAIPLYRRALKANPKNVAARAGLDEAQAALKER